MVEQNFLKGKTGLPVPSSESGLDIDVNYFGIHGAAIRVSTTEAKQLQNIPCAAVCIQNDGDNLGDIYVGGVGAAAAQQGRDYRIYVGGERIFPVNNTNELTVIGDSEGDLVRYHIYRNYEHQPNIDYTVPPYIDVIPPTVTSTTPVNASTEVEVNTEISATFSEDIDPISITSDSVTITPSVTKIVYRDSLNPRKVILKPTSNLDNNTTYNVTWTNVLKDLAGNAMTSNYGIIFTTIEDAPPADTTPPTVVSTNIANGAVNVPINIGSIFAICSEDIDANTLTVGSITITPSIDNTLSRDSIDFRKITMTFDEPLEYATLYIVTFTSTIEDLAGNGMNPITQIAFSTEQEPVVEPPPPPPDTEGPTLVSSTPTNGATGVTISSPVVNATFNENILASTVIDGNIGITPNIPKTVAVDTNDAKKINITFTTALSYSTTYTITFTSGIKDMAGNSISTPITFSFTTEAAPPDVTKPTLVSWTPADGATNISVSSPGISGTFSEALDPTSVSNTTVTISPTFARTTALDPNDPKKIIITPSVALANSTFYVVTYTAGIKDLAGNTLTALSKSFNTIAAPDVTPPSIVTKTPDSNATGVQPSVSIVITFSEPIQSAGVTANNFKLVKTENSETITTTRSLSADSLTVTMAPTSSLDFSKQYQVTLNGDTTKIKDLVGNSMVGTTSWTFTTRPTQETIKYNVSNNGSAWNMGENFVNYAGVKITSTSHPLYNIIPHKVVLKGRRNNTPTTNCRLVVVTDPDNFNWGNFGDDIAGWYAANIDTGYGRIIGSEISVGSLVSSGSSDMTFEDATQTQPLGLNHLLVLHYSQGNSNNYLKLLYNNTNAQTNAAFYYGLTQFESNYDFAALVYQNS